MKLLNIIRDDNNLCLHVEEDGQYDEMHIYLMPVDVLGEQVVRAVSDEKLLNLRLSDPLKEYKLVFTAYQFMRNEAINFPIQLD